MFSLMILENMLVLFFFSIGALQAACPSGWLAWQDSCYIVMAGNMNWAQAEEACMRLGANLMVPNSQIEQDFVWQNLEKVHDTDSLWIGCKKTGDYQAYTLECLGVHGDPAYQNWEDGEPDSEFECVRMSGMSGAWRDKECSYSTNIFGACEMEAVPYSRAAMKFNLVPHSCLINHQIKSYPVKESIGCGLGCWAEPLCRSFNLLQQAGDSKICQLNTATLLEADDVTNIYNDENCFFYE